MSRTIVVRNLPRRSSSTWSRMLCWVLGGFTSSSRSINPSTEPNSVSSLMAVLAPTPGTPGMLSVVSPCSALMSATASGPSPPYRSFTLSTSYIVVRWTL